MEAIKIYYPDKSLMEDTLTEAAANELFKKLKTITEADESEWAKLAKENFPNEYNQVLREMDEDAASMIAVGAFAVLVIIGKLISWIKNKYRLTIQKLYGNSKELNDIYTKVSDMLANDKMARFKHRNDLMDGDIQYIIMQDKKDSSKKYQLIIDNLAYNSEFFIKQINDIMAYVDSQSKKDKEANIKKMTDDLMNQIQQGFMNNHGFVLTCDPMMKSESYNKIKLEKYLTRCKDWVSAIYRILYIYNQNVSGQLQYLQLLQQAYGKMIKDYGKDKDAKNMIDTIFKQLIKNVTASMDFNSKSMVILNEMIKFYSDMLTKIYEHIKE